MKTPSFKRRMASLFYDALLMAGLLFMAGFLVVGLLPQVTEGWPRRIYQFYLLGVAGLYLTWAWHRGGQTLAMKTWRLRVIDEAGRAPGWSLAWLRYALALLGFLTGGLGFLWALWDRDRQYLHDHLIGTRIVQDD